MSNFRPVLIPQNDFACRFNFPGSSTLQTRLHEKEDGRLQESDPSAWELTRALIQDAFEYGLDQDDNAELYDSCPDCPYRAPVGDRAIRKAGRGKPFPWVGELRVEGVGAGDGQGGWWRTYFHDLIRGGQLADDVLLTAVRLKTPEKRFTVVGPFKMNQQDRDVLDAIDTARRWEKSQSRYRLRARNV